MKKTLESFTELSKEFHPSLNGGLKPSDFSFGSKKKVWWQCPKNQLHVFDMPINDRTNKKCSCPYCSGRRVIPEESLNATNSEIASEWHPLKNKELKPTQVSRGSGKKVCWICKKGHEYVARIHDRTIKGSGCPYCADRLATNETSLHRRFPKVAKEWHPTKNGNLSTKDVTAFSSKLVWFVCPKSDLHDYRARIADRTDKKKVGCPFCSGVRVAPDTSLEFKFPEIAKEWNHQKNKSLKPSQVTAGSNRNIWWICSKGHEFKITPHERTFFNRGCNQCSKFGSSQETRIYCELKAIFGDIKFRHKIDDVEIDIFVPSIGLGIEYDSAYYHLERTENDLSKNQLMGNKNYFLVRVREHPLTIISENDVITPQREITKPDMNTLFEQIGKRFSHLSNLVQEYIGETDFINNEDYSIYMSYFPSPFPENSLAETHPEITAHWDVEKNYPLTPYNFTHGSKHRAYWICEKGHSEIKSINSKVSRFSSQFKCCGHCSGRIIQEADSLLSKKPELCRDWHPRKNGDLKPNVVSCGSDRKVWWQCYIHPIEEWEAVIRLRVRGLKKCRLCNPPK